jgi:hypothetical protein
MGGGKLGLNSCDRWRPPAVLELWGHCRMMYLSGIASNLYCLSKHDPANDKIGEASTAAILSLHGARLDERTHLWQTSRPPRWRCEDSGNHGIFLMSAECEIECGT